MRIISEFFIFESVFPKLIEKIKSILNSIRKNFNSHSNYKNFQENKKLLEKKINKALYTEEKFNIIKLNNKNFGYRTIKKYKNIDFNKERYFSILDYIFFLAEEEIVKEDLSMKEPLNEFNSLICIPKIEDLKVKADKILDFEYCENQNKRSILDNNETNDGIYSVDLNFEFDEQHQSSINNDNFLKKVKEKDFFKNQNKEKKKNYEFKNDIYEEFNLRVHNKEKKWKDKKFDNFKLEEIETDSKNLFSNTEVDDIEQDSEKCKCDNLKFNKLKRDLFVNNKKDKEKIQLKASKKKLDFKIIQDKEKKYIKYIGEILDGKYHGKGIYFHSNGNIKYKGNFKNNKYNGFGIYLNKEGDNIFFGQFIEDFACGGGVEFSNIERNSSIIDSFSSPNSNSKNNENLNLSEKEDSDYSEFINNKNLKFNFYVKTISNFYRDFQLGFGIYFNEDDSIYEGKFIKGSLYDFGTYYNRNGHIEYQGFFHNDKFNGIGIYFIENEKLFFFGELKNNEYEGFGVFLDENMKILHKGEYRNGQGCGFGKYFNIHNENLEYEGFFKNGLYDGIGVLYDNTNGFVKYIGKFKAGKINKKITINKNLYKNDIDSIILNKFQISFKEKCKVLDKKLSKIEKFLSIIKKRNLQIFN